MGCWGLGLFQSDHDYDVVSELSGEAGVDRLYTPDDPAALRDVLEKDGKLSKMFDKWETRGDGYGIGTTPKYSTVILGACAMEVGAKIEERHLSLLRNIYSSCGLYEEGERQMKVRTLRTRCLRPIIQHRTIRYGPGSRSCRHSMAASYLP